ncbi:MAG TPA: mechanosensitive ion channel domain-containing protein [Crinalium sp.]|jgi:small conductance mechanosensitive channel
MVNDLRTKLWRRRNSPILAIAFMVVSVLLIILTNSQIALGQASRSPTTEPPSPKPGLQIDTSVLGGWFSNSPPSIAREDVRLDGRKLFMIATPQLTESNQANQTPNPLRVDIIEERLQSLAQRKFDPDTLRVFSDLDRSSRQPILYVRYSDGKSEQQDELMTVTDLDAQLHATDSEALATELAQVIEAALIRARQERQPAFLKQQVIWAAGILITMMLSSLLIFTVQRRLKHQRSQLKARGQANQQQLSHPVDATDTAGTPRISTALLQQQMDNRQKKGVNDIQRRLLQFLQLVIWIGGSFLMLGLFPYSRWLQAIAISWLEIPVKIFGIFLGSYLLVRFSEVLIDRFFLVLQDSTSFAPEVSQRTVLRFSTFSRVGKSILALLIVGSAVITALSVVGVQVGPLLAGAGIIGLAVSFASQSLIKDMINGFLILLEDQYGVGDVIIVGDVSGLVENMNLRITQLRNEEGRLITIPNSSIAIVQNLSKEWARVDLQVSVAYHANMDQALAVIEAVAQEMSGDRPWKDLILEKPLLLGIDKLDHMGATIRLWIKTQPLKQWEVAREYRRRLKLAFDQAGIPIGIPQQSLSVSNPAELEDELDALTKKHRPSGEVKPPSTPTS